jgi:hypothetical protein
MILADGHQNQRSVGGKDELSPAHIRPGLIEAEKVLAPFGVVFLPNARPGSFDGNK